MANDVMPDALQELSAKLHGGLSWDVLTQAEAVLGQIVLRGPSGRTRTAVAAYSHSVKALERWLVRAADTLRQKEALNGCRHPSHRRVPLRNGSPVTQGPQTLGELVLEKCGPDSDEWKNYQRLNRLVGVSTPEALQEAIKREQELLRSYADKMGQAIPDQT